jgi:hypothetical protein
MNHEVRGDNPRGWAQGPTKLVIKLKVCRVLKLFEVIGSIANLGGLSRGN